MDGTGALFYAMGEPFEKKQSVLYTVVKKAPNNTTPTPLVEFVLSEANVPAILFCLFHFFNK